MKPPHMKSQLCGGFSLVELALLLTIIGLLGQPLLKFVAAIKNLPAFANSNGSSGSGVNTLDQAESALNGYILAHGRLPCPDTTASNAGVEVCSGSTSIGWLPVRTLGLNLTQKVRYGVYRATSATPALDMDLASLPDRYKPLLPDRLNAMAPINLNGLDFCAGLRNLAGTVGAAVLTAGAQHIPVAYGLAVAGAGDMDNVTDVDGRKSVFDGLNMTYGQFELAGTAHSAIYDDDTRTVGGAELFVRLGCASRMAAANAAARAAYAANDLDLFAASYVTLRNFQVTVHESNVKMAKISLDLAYATLANAIGSSASAVTLLGLTEGSSALDMVAAATDLIVAIPLVIKAARNSNTKDAELAIAQSQSAAAVNFKTTTGADLIAAANLVGMLDQKGLLP